MLESNIQTSIKKELVKAGWKVIKLIHTSEPGIPDQLALRNGRTVFIEVKQPGKTPTPLQLARQHQLREQGFEVIVAVNKNDVRHLCSYG